MCLAVIIEKYNSYALFQQKALIYIWIFAETFNVNLKQTTPRFRYLINSPQKVAINLQVED